MIDRFCAVAALAVFSFSGDSRRPRPTSTTAVNWNWTAVLCSARLLFLPGSEGHPRRGQPQVRAIPRRQLCFFRGFDRSAGAVVVVTAAVVIGSSFFFFLSFIRGVGRGEGLCRNRWLRGRFVSARRRWLRALRAIDLSLQPAHVGLPFDVCSPRAGGSFFAGCGGAA